MDFHLAVLARNGQGEQQRRAQSALSLWEGEGMSKADSVTYGGWCSDFEPAELFIVQQLGDSRMGSAQRAIRITTDADFTEPHGERIVHQQASEQGVPLLQEEFNRLGCLYDSNDPG